MDEGRHYLCSELISLTVNGVTSIVNLEEIWPAGAFLECEGSLKTGAFAEIRCRSALFAGHIVSVVRHEIGWRAEIRFSPLTPWSLATYRPDHLLDVLPES